MIISMITRRRHRRNPQMLQHAERGGAIRVVAGADGWIWRHSTPSGRGTHGTPQPSEAEAWIDAWPHAAQTDAVMLAPDHIADMIRLQKEIHDHAHA